MKSLAESLWLRSSCSRRCYGRLSQNGGITRAQALNVIEKALVASHGKGSSKEEQDVAQVTVETLQGVRESMADVVN